MKKQYTKKQIKEALAYWKKRLNESSVEDGILVTARFSKYAPDITTMWSLEPYEWEIKQTDEAIDIFRQWKTVIENYYKDKGFNVEVISISGPVHYDNEFDIGLKCFADCDKNELQDFLDSEL